ncbi:MAG: AAA family ATPase, partial [Planctomycetes bacterium]|nr:AAA family ATPase [Planctomycetota bacterium]
EGTYPLPEAQLDRFLFKVEVPGVDAGVLTRILGERRHGAPPAVEPALSAAELDELFALVDAVFLPEAVANYIARLVASSHPGAAGAPALVAEAVRFGASPRAAIAIGEAARAAALIAGRPNVDFADVQRTCRPALVHRLVLQHAAIVAGTTGGAVVDALLAAVPEVARGLPEAVQ